MRRLLICLAYLALAGVSAQAKPDENDPKWACYDAFPLPNEDDKAKFIEDIRPFVIDAERTWHVPASILAGMAALESGYGRTRTAWFANNIYGRKETSETTESYTLKCQDGMADPNAKYRKYTNWRESIMDTAKLLATSPYYRDATAQVKKAYASGDDKIAAAKAFLATIAYPYNGSPIIYVRNVIRIINDPISPKQEANAQRTLWAFSIDPPGTAQATVAKALDTYQKNALAKGRDEYQEMDLPQAATKAALAVLLDKNGLPRGRYMMPEKGCSAQSYPGWEDFPTQLCTYEPKRNDGVSTKLPQVPSKGETQLRVVLLTPSVERIARWVAATCLPLSRAPGATAEPGRDWSDATVEKAHTECGTKAANLILKASGGQFPVAGMVAEDLARNATNSKSGKPECINYGKSDDLDEIYIFRDGITSKLAEVTQSPCHSVTSVQNELALCLPGSGRCGTVEAVRQYARVQSTTRCQHLCVQDPIAKAKLDDHPWFKDKRAWPIAVRQEYQKAFRSDLNELLFATMLYAVTQKSELLDEGCMIFDQTLKNGSKNLRAAAKRLTERNICE